MEQATRSQISTEGSRLYLALELSAKEWKLGFSDGRRVRLVTLAAKCWRRLDWEIAQAKNRLGLPADVSVVSCYEAGRDGFWIHWLLQSLGVANVVIDAASIEVDRRARRRKTDLIDVRKLLSLLVRYAGGEGDVWRVVRVPSPEEEDARRPHRERERLVKERTQHRARLKSLLVMHGVADKIGSGFGQALATLRCWDDQPLPQHLQAELAREWCRLEQVQEQIAALEREQRKRAAAGQTPRDLQVRRLTELRGVGFRGASVLVGEFFSWRDFSNRRQVGAAAGMTGTPYNSGDSVRDQGISKAGNRRVRTLMVELAWGWLRWQPQSELARWFVRRTGPGKRTRRVMIVALARRLLVALWHYLKHGVVPQGAILSPA